MNTPVLLAIGLILMNFVVAIIWLLRERKTLSLRGKILVVIGAIPLCVIHIFLCIHAIITGVPEEPIVTEKLLYRSP